MLYTIVYSHVHALTKQANKLLDSSPIDSFPNVVQSITPNY